MRERRRTTVQIASPADAPRSLQRSYSGGLGDILREVYWSRFFRLVPELAKRGYPVVIDVQCLYPQARELFGHDPRYRYMTFRDLKANWLQRELYSDRACESYVESLAIPRQAEVSYRLPLEPHPLIKDYLEAEIPYVACQPFGGKVSGYGKQMAARQIEAAARRLTEAGYALVLLHDIPIEIDIDSAFEVVNLMGQTSIPQACWIVRESAGFLGVDSLLKYVALISEVPTVVYWGFNKREIEHFLGQWRKSPELRLVLSPDDFVWSVPTSQIVSDITWILEQEGGDNDNIDETAA